jgi:hypothetical protein
MFIREGWAYMVNDRSCYFGIGEGLGELEEVEIPDTFIEVIWATNYDATHQPSRSQQ